MIYANKKNGFNHSESIADGAEGEAIIVKHGRNEGDKVGVAVITSGNTGKIQYTFSSMEKIEDDIANWIDWDDGEVASNAGTAFTAPVTAIRGVSVSGAITIEVAI